MKSLTEPQDTKSLQYKSAKVLPVEKADVNTKPQLLVGRTVATTKTSGFIALRYAPKQPK